MARAYPYYSSVIPGGTLVLNVATLAPHFRIDFYRQGQTLEFKSSSRFFDGPAPEGTPAANVDFGWLGFSFPVPSDWTSGVYIASIVEWDGQGAPPPVQPLESAFDRMNMTLFVVRSATPGATSATIYKISLNTYHAYNGTGGGSFYSGHPTSRNPWVPLSMPPDPPGKKVTLRRPGGGTGGDLEFDVPDAYDPNSHPGAFVYWDAPFIAWLERSGYQVDYCTDVDIHADFNFLRHYRLLLSVGHDEYWSLEERLHVEQFSADGGNVAFFSGNICWWRVHFVDNDTAMVCQQTGIRPPPSNDDQWWCGNNPAPENLMTGVSYRNGGGWWGGRRERVGFAVQNLDHWVFSGIPLNDKQVIGNTREPPVVGYECDGAPVTFDSGGHGILLDNPKAFTPSGFVLLGVGRLTQLGDGNTGWYTEFREPEINQLTNVFASTMGAYENNGTVFTAGTSEWPRTVASGVEPEIEQITRNVLDHLGGVDMGNVNYGLWVSGAIGPGESVTYFEDDVSPIKVRWYSAAPINPQIDGFVDYEQLVTVSQVYYLLKGSNIEGTGTLQVNVTIQNLSDTDPLAFEVYVAETE